MLYSEKVMDHFTNPLNVGETENPSCLGEVGNAAWTIMKKSSRAKMSLSHVFMWWGFLFSLDRSCIIW